MKIRVTRGDIPECGQVWEVRDYSAFWGAGAVREVNGSGILLAGEYEVLPEESFRYSEDNVERLESVLCAIAFDFGRCSLVRVLPDNRELPPGLMDLNLLKIMGQVEDWESRLTYYEAAELADQLAGEVGAFTKLAQSYKDAMKTVDRMKPELNMGED